MRTHSTVAARRELTRRTAGVHHHRNRVSRCPEPVFAIVGIRSSGTGQELRLLLHQPVPALEQVRSRIGRPRLVRLHVGQRQIDHFARGIRSLRGPAVEARPESVGTAAIPSFVSREDSVDAESVPPRGFENTQPVPPVLSRAASRMSSARADSSTRCSLPIFIRSGGTLQRRSAMSISSHRARRASWERAAVNTRNSNVRFKASPAFDSPTVRIASATSA